MALRVQRAPFRRAFRRRGAARGLPAGPRGAAAATKIKSFGAAFVGNSCVLTPLRPRQFRHGTCASEDATRKPRSSFRACNEESAEAQAAATVASFRRSPEGRAMASRVSEDFVRQLQGFCLTTAEILYRLPDHLSLLQTYVWQDYDLAPEFPALHKFLDFWDNSLDGPLHSVRVAHVRLVGPTEIRTIKAQFALH
jgi:uncharacterized protein Usg